MTALKLKHTLNKWKHVINIVATIIRVIRQDCSSSNKFNVQQKNNKSDKLLGELVPWLYLELSEQFMPLRGKPTN